MCTACKDNKPHARAYLKQHESRQSHKDAVAYHLAQQSGQSSSMSGNLVADTVPGVRILLEDMSFDQCLDHSDSPGIDYQDSIPQLDTTDYYAATSSATPVSPHHDLDIPLLSQALLNFLDNDELSDDDVSEQREF